MCFILHKRLEPALGAADGSGAGPRSLDKTRESKMSIPEFDITGHKVLIVGGGRGIGKGIALAFAEAGAEVAVSALTPTGVNKVAEEIQAMGGKDLLGYLVDPRRGQGAHCHLGTGLGKGQGNALTNTAATAHD